MRYFQSQALLGLRATVAILLKHLNEWDAQEADRPRQYLVRWRGHNGQEYTHMEDAQYWQEALRKVRQRIPEMQPEQVLQIQDDSGRIVWEPIR